MIIVDASVLIAHLDGNDAHHERAEHELAAAADHELGASSITLAEVLVGPARIGRLAEAQAALRELEIAEVPVPRGASEALAGLRARTGLKLPDCCVILAAQLQRADAMLAFDDRLRKYAGELGFSTTLSG